MDLDACNYVNLFARNMSFSARLTREKTDLVKGFEYAKNKYIEIDPEELKALRLQEDE
jgi:non-homologous end joining protein Ku